MSGKRRTAIVKQNFDVDLLSAAHLGQRLDSGLPHSAQNFLAPVLSIPHFEQRIALYQSTIAPTGKTDESERERTEQV